MSVCKPWLLVVVVACLSTWHLNLLTVAAKSESMPSPEPLIGQNGLVDNKLDGDTEEQICNTKGCVRSGK